MARAQMLLGAVARRAVHAIHLAIEELI